VERLCVDDDDGMVSLSGGGGDDDDGGERERQRETHGPMTVVVHRPMYLSVLLPATTDGALRKCTPCCNVRR
jgi:hypothetical protein